MTSADEAQTHLTQGYMEGAVTCTIHVTVEAQQQWPSVEFQAYRWISCLCLEQNYTCVIQYMGISSLRLYKCYLKRYWVDFKAYFNFGKECLLSVDSKRRIYW